MAKAFKMQDPKSVQVASQDREMHIPGIAEEDRRRDVYLEGETALYSPYQVSTYPQPTSFPAVRTNDPAFAARTPIRLCRTRTYFTYEQLEELENKFQKGHYPSLQIKKELSETLGVEPARITVSSRRLL